MSKSHDKGFTLVELLVFVTILSIFFVTAVSVAVASLRNIKNNEQRLLATRYAEELAEWLRSEREADWVTFTSYGSNTPNGEFYCFTNTPVTDWIGHNANCNYNSLQPPIFKRYLLLKTYNNGNQATATINVSWNVGVGSTLNVPLTLNFAVWEQRP